MNYYEILEVSEKSSSEVITGAYKALTKKYHPDISKDALASEKMKIINLAYEVLSDPIKRAEYDRKIHLNLNNKTTDMGNSYSSSNSNSRNRYESYDEHDRKKAQQQAEERRKREYTRKREEEEKARKEAEARYYKQEAERKAAELKAEAKRKKKRDNIWKIAIFLLFLAAVNQYYKSKLINDTPKAIPTPSIYLQSTPNPSSKPATPSSLNSANSALKSNLDYIAYDDNPNDSVYYFYKIDSIDNEKHYRYNIIIDINKNEMDVNRELYYNEWHAYEGGRITGSAICSDAPIKWNEGKTEGYSDLSKGRYGRNYQISFSFTKSKLTVIQLGGDDYFDFSGTYRGAVPKTE